MAAGKIELQFMNILEEQTPCDQTPQQFFAISTEDPYCFYAVSSSPD
jgi:hypothetical protein